MIGAWKSNLLFVIIGLPRSPLSVFPRQWDWVRTGFKGAKRKCGSIPPPLKGSWFPTYPVPPSVTYNPSLPAPFNTTFDIIITIKLHPD
ncbi:hypothetical protein F4820DRAFT_90819 [Hypoxylon rubiginosum]|uniref:Uncharacterized protein n=1 Tax=Hypoxylon rubiginosum TaxID=110542 RepID=A0ACB9ZBH3_9PEZI|nr:hypothetical protein F4820DRAFT_90819 [Hypoxylon rubiginosum]